MTRSTCSPIDHELCREIGICTRKIYHIATKRNFLNFFLKQYDKHLISLEPSCNSPLQIAIPLYYFYLQKENVEEKKRISLIIFGDRYTDLSIRFMLKYSAYDDVQIIMIYEKGKHITFDLANRTTNNSEISKMKSSLEINWNLLLLPLDFKKEVMGSSEWDHIFQNVVSPAISSFHPDLVIIDHCFNFKTQQIIFSDQDCSIWKRILYHLRKASSNNILLVSRNLSKEKNIEFVKKYHEASASLSSGKHKYQIQGF